METQHQTHDVAAERQARARIRVAKQLLAQATDPEERKAIEAAIAELEGSWITTTTVDRPDVLSEEAGRAFDAMDALEAERQAIRDELAANDAKIIRSLIEGDQGRIGAHNEAQAELRKRLAAI